jgi:hypothetical protein
MFKNLLNRLLGLIVAVIFLGGWLYLPNNIKGVVFFWSFPIIGIVGLFAFLFGDINNRKK